MREPELGACPEVPGARVMDGVGGSRPEARARLGQLRTQSQRGANAYPVSDTTPETTPVHAGRGEELTMAARRFSRLQKRLLAWLALDEQRTRGLIE